jgi:hypothetical protein
VPDDRPTDEDPATPGEPEQHEDPPQPAGEQERADDGMAPLVTNTGDDGDPAPTG